MNLTNYTYFNLSGHPDKDILNELVYINSDSITPLDSTYKTSGTFMKVEQTPFDFRTTKPVGQDIEADNEQLRNGRGYDHNFVLNTNGDIRQLAGKIIDKESYIGMEIYTIEPGLQFYVCNFLDGTDEGKKGHVYIRIVRQFVWRPSISRIHQIC